jgi:hypothetical protein
MLEDEEDEALFLRCRLLSLAATGGVVLHTAASTTQADMALRLRLRPAMIRAVCRPSMLGRKNLHDNFGRVFSYL